MTLGRQGEEGAGYEYLGRYYLETGRDAAARTNLEKAVSKYGINAPGIGRDPQTSRRGKGSEGKEAERTKSTISDTVGPVPRH